MTTPNPARILIVDDEKNLCEFLSIILTRDGYTVATAASGPAALASLAADRFDLVIQDVRMPGMDGIELLREIKARDAALPVVVMTAYATWATAVEAMRLGAFDFIRKPFDNDAIRDIVRRVLEAGRRPPAPEEDRSAPQTMETVGNSAPMAAVFAQIRAAARTEATVLITGESGTGKELVARALHHGSPRHAASFIAINCSALVTTLLESEIFGHVRGAFTGAERDKKGLLELADGGTFFLDEIGDMDPALQGKILKVLEDRDFYPVGGTTRRHADVRFLAATNQDLAALTATGRFRQDLYYRLNVIPIHLPPLRDRAGDLPLLAGYFLKRYSHRYGKAVRGFDDAAMALLARHGWPGNVRELENCIQRALLVTAGETIRAADIGSFGLTAAPGPAVVPPVLPPGFDLEAAIADLERRYIEQALAEHGHNMTDAAAALGMNFRAIRYKVKKYGIVVHGRKDPHA
ncbi:MAG: sigma-54 dependent transcriptional regulator [Planctomycetota bacterium]